MWPRYVVRDNFLSKKHFDSIKDIKFDTKPNDWDIYKHKIYNDGKIEIGFQSSTGVSSYTAEEIRGYGAKNRLPKKVTEKMLRQHQRKEGNSPLSEEDIREIHNTYHDQMINWLKELAPEKLQYYWYTELNVVNNGKNHIFPIHSDSRDKLLSVVIYIAPEVNEGTTLYEDKSGQNPKQIEWIPNRAFVFSRNDHTWHSYRADGKNNRLTLVYNLRSDKYWKK